MRTDPEPPHAGGEPEDPRLIEWAEAVAEGTPADWARRSADAPELSGALAGLQSLALLGETMRASAAPRPAREVAFRWGELEVLTRLGGGATGEVWRAWDPSLEREVALKLAPAGSAPSRPLAEARRLARLRHANVVAVLGADVRDGRAGLWMELVEGRSLEQTLAEHGHYGAHEATGIGLELCRALAAVHQAGFVHGDVGPRNVMRERGGRIVLMDLGSAAPLGDDSAAIVTGTPLVTAPERLAGGPASVSADLYALGCLLFRLVTGRFPVEAGTLAELREAHAAGRRLSLRTLRPDLPHAFVHAVEAVLAPDPAARPADAAAFERLLADSLSPAASGTRADESARVRRAWSRTLRPAAMVSGGALVALLLTTQWLGREPSRGSAPPRAADPAAPAPAPAAADAPPLVVELAAFVRTRDGVSERVTSGAAVRLGDELSLEVRAAEPLHLYVLNEDDAGAVFALFPAPGTDVTNPVPAGRTVALPGARDGRTLHWQVSSPARRERFLIVASRQPLAALEQRLAAMPQVSEADALSAVELDGPALDRLRGVGRIRPATPARRRHGALESVADALGGEPGLWVRSVELEHTRD